jgi:cellobiose PTS system EIIB component
MREVNKMKVLLVCASGASTSILMKKMKKYAEEKGFLLDIIAKGIGDYQDYYKDFDIILLGPQMSYKKTDIMNVTKMPLDVIAPYDYAIGNVENIFKQIDTLLP